jgi:hypothetical protein
VQDPVPGAGDQAGVAVFIEVLVDEELDDCAVHCDRGRQRVRNVDGRNCRQLLCLAFMMRHRRAVSHRPRRNGHVRRRAGGFWRRG